MLDLREADIDGSASSRESEIVTELQLIGLVVPVYDLDRADARYSEFDGDSVWCGCVFTRHGDLKLRMLHRIRDPKNVLPLPAQSLSCLEDWSRLSKCSTYELLRLLRDTGWTCSVPSRGVPPPVKCLSTGKPEVSLSSHILLESQHRKLFIISQNHMSHGATESWVQRTATISNSRYSPHHPPPSHDGHTASLYGSY